ncbi:MAG: DUF4349 domain-containing protein [Marmoricola sp.]
MPRAALAVPFVMLVALLASCGVGASSNDAKSASDAGGSTASGESADSSNSLVGPAAKAAAPTGAKQAVATALSRAVISTGQVSLHSKSVNKARVEVMRLVASWNGTIANEQTNSDDRGRIVDSTMTLRVPTATFSQAMNELARIGEVEQQSRKSEDVTTKVLDNDARVRAAERSIRQIELLLGRASKLSDIIAIESDLARRQADLDSLKSQQAWLEDQTSLSTITVYLNQPATAAHKHDARGFLAGLDGGWTALKGTTVVLLTALGAVLPFAVLVVLFGLPVWVVVRRRLGAHVSAGSAPAQSA